MKIPLTMETGEEFILGFMDSERQQVIAALRRVTIDLEALNEKTKMTDTFRSGIDYHIASARAILAKNDLAEKARVL